MTPLPSLGDDLSRNWLTINHADSGWPDEFLPWSHRPIGSGDSDGNHGHIHPPQKNRKSGLERPDGSIEAAGSLRKDSHQMPLGQMVEGFPQSTATSPLPLDGNDMADPHEGPQSENPKQRIAGQITHRAVQRQSNQQRIEKTLVIREQQGG